MNKRGLRLVSNPAAGNESTSSEKVIWKPKKRRAAVLELIGSAQRSLLLSIFRCDDLSVLHELGEAVARGVRVEALMTGQAKGWGKRLAPLAGCLERMGVVIHRRPEGVMKYHAKYMVADEAQALVGTLNLTRKCFRRTRDFVLNTADPAVVTGLAEMFRADSSAVVLRREQRSERLIIGPDDTRQRIETLLGGAKRSIRILDHKLSDPAMLAILRDRQRKGVAVEIERGDRHDSLAAHGRLIVIDQATAIFGSFSLSARSLDERRELAVVIQAPELVTKLQRQFEKATVQAARASELVA